MLSKLERRSIYWDMYVAAVGLAMMDARILHACWLYNSDEKELPEGMCSMSKMVGLRDIEGLIELQELKPRSGAYWFEILDWKPRAKLLLKAWEATF